MRGLHGIQTHVLRELYLIYQLNQLTIGQQKIYGEGDEGVKKILLFYM